METEKLTASLDELETRLFALRHAMGLLSLDGATAAPKGSSRPRGITVGVLSAEEYRLRCGEETRCLLEEMENRASLLPAVTRRRVEELLKGFRRVSRIPLAEYSEYARTVSVASDVWHESKEKDDFASFLPWLEKIVEMKRRFALYQDGGKDPYDTLLDDYEKGASRETLDPFFRLLRERLVPLIRAIGEKPRPRGMNGRFPIERQKELTGRLMDFLGLDRRYCAVAETEHPFTDSFSRYDVRISTHYHEEDPLPSLYSVIHEGGHALYELGTGEELQFTCLGRGATMGIHESQSRFFENIIGRSRAFVTWVHPVLEALFPEEMRSFGPEEVYRAANLVTPSLIRTEADEVTYPLHIMVRYELEKALMDGSLRCAELPGAWREMYREYLGIVPGTDREGVLQDCHWSGGMIGYFPSYALGSAYGAQMLHEMKKTVDVDGAVLSGNLSPVTAWLRDRVHRHGRMLEAPDILGSAFGGNAFDPEYYVRYLTEKYTAVYGL